MAEASSVELSTGLTYWPIAEEPGLHPAGVWILVRQNCSSGDTQAECLCLFKSHRRLHRRYLCVFLLTNKVELLPGTLSLLVSVSTSQPAHRCDSVTLSPAGKSCHSSISEKETSLPHNCWLVYSFKSFSWNNNKIFIKQCVWKMWGAVLAISKLFFFFQVTVSSCKFYN